MELNYINLDYLRSIAGENNELIIEMLDIFREQAPEFTDGMKQAYGQEDWATLSGIAHKAKSSIAVLGMEKMAAELKALEINAKNGELPHTYLDTIEGFEQVCQLALEEITVIEKELKT